MKRIKTFKLFEAYLESPQFYRFSHQDIIGDNTEIEWSRSKDRVLTGQNIWNDSLISAGFPDRLRCVHFMDERAFSPDLKSVYGKNVYVVKVDENSIIGWTFFVTINEWYYNYGYTLTGTIRKNPIISQELNRIDPNFLEESDLGKDKSELTELCQNKIDTLLEAEFIGFGTVTQLMNSPYWGKYPLFAWTTDPVNITRKPEEVKVAKSYKKERLLTPDDFTDLGLSGADIPNFYKSEFGKIVISVSTREEALELLNQWYSTYKK
jgi:hypothetical protein